MPAGRKPKGPDLVDGLEASALARQRLKVVLQSVAGEISVAEACRALDLSEAGFHKLRARILRGALDEAEPKTLGRPPKERPVETVVALEKQIADLWADLRAAQIREQLALLMPHVMTPSAAAGEEKKRDRRIRDGARNGISKPEDPAEV
jgi:hypothetical protein